MKSENEELIKLSTLLNEYKKAVDVSNIVSKTDEKGIIIYVNDKFCEISGYKREELIGKPHNIVRHPDMPSEAFEELWESIKHKKVWNGIVKNLKKDGTYYFVDATIVPILDEHSNIVEYIGIRHDVSELILKTQEVEDLKLKQMRENLGKAIEITLESTIKSVPIPTIVINYEDMIIHFNEEFKAIFDMFEDKGLLKKLKEFKLNLKELFDFSIINDELVDWKNEQNEYKLTLKDKNLNVKLKLKELKESEDKKYIVILIFED